MSPNSHDELSTANAGFAPVPFAKQLLSMSIRQSMEATLSSVCGNVKSFLDAAKFWYNHLRIWLKNNPSSGESLWAQDRCIKKEDFFSEVIAHFTSAIDLDQLLKLSLGLQSQFREALTHHKHCMLPSYNYELPQGKENGTYLALDVGGSTFRVAMVDLQKENDEKMKLVALQSYKIDNSVKLLEGPFFFDWMVEKISLTISGKYDTNGLHLLAGLAWSFPIEQTSLRTGLLQPMGKGFSASEGLIGRDLGEVFQEACGRANLPIKLGAIINDSSATLLSKAYSDPSTRMGLILGTGVNVAAHLPVELIGSCKLGDRPSDWRDLAHHVIVNTELSMFGRGVLQLTPWDIQLNQAHPRPDFQPFEHLVGGRYMGEIARLVLIDGVEHANLFNGILPVLLTERYSLDTEVLAHLQSSKNNVEASDIFNLHYPSNSNSISDRDISFIRHLARLISRRASAMIAVSLQALWVLRAEVEEQSRDFEAGQSQNPMIVACCGSVIQNYPGFQEDCQKYLDALIERTGSTNLRKLQLLIATESSLLGAAVAVAVANI